MRALVTGATGFIGQHFVRRLLQEGHEVHLLERGRDALTVVRESRPEVVFHFASLFLAEHKYEQIESLCESNLTFGTQLVDAMLNCGVNRLVCAGTAWQNFAGQKGVATNLYAATKEAFEVILRYYAHAHGLQATVLKLSDTYGPADPRRKLMSILRQAIHEGQPLGLSPGEQKIDLLHVHDVVNAFLTAAQQITARTEAGVDEYYLRSGRLLSIKDLVRIFDEVTGQPLVARWGERPYRAREVMTPWQEGPVLPGWKPEISLEDGIRAYMAEEQCLS